ncbi:MAG: hypothetical protein HY673_25730 [Chloroflexi bacterium]|nr:hypothetical protein [Chloroflexota bacterium]
MKSIDYPSLLDLNESSIRAQRRQHLKPEQLPAGPGKPFIVNFHFEHEWDGQKDVRMSVILKPALLTAWLDVSPEEYEAIPEVEMNELEWEGAVCVGTPPWTK